MGLQQVAVPQGVYTHPFEPTPSQPLANPGKSRKIRQTHRGWFSRHAKYSAFSPLHLSNADIILPSFGQINRRTDIPCAFQRFSRYVCVSYVLYYIIKGLFFVSNFFSKVREKVIKSFPTTPHFHNVDEDFQYVLKKYVARAIEFVHKITNC